MAPKRKKAVRRQKRQTKDLNSLSTLSITRESEQSFSELPSPQPVFTKKFILVTIALVLLVIGAYLKRNWFIVAFVDGRPITRIALDRVLVKQYGPQTLDNMINESLINQEVANQHITVSESDIDQKIAEITAGLPEGVTLDQALQLQGMDSTEFKKQIKIQLGIDKILASKITVSEKEISQYIATNTAQFKDASPAAAQASAKNILLRQKENDAFTEWFATLRKNAKIAKFI